MMEWCDALTPSVTHINITEGFPYRNLDYTVYKDKSYLHCLLQLGVTEVYHVYA